MNLYQFTCVETVAVNPTDIRQQQQQQVKIFGEAETLEEAVRKFEEFAKDNPTRIEVMGVGIIGQKAF